jgi:hypothetical protein
MTADEMDEEVYSTIFNALRHDVRRNILRMLEDKELTHTEIAESLGISSSHLTYHLDNLKDLVTKTEQGYALSRFGEAAVQMTKTVESPPQVEESDKKRLKAIIIVLSLSFLLITGATIKLFNLSSTQSRKMSALDQKVDSFSERLDQYSKLDEMLGSSSDILLTTGRELTLQVGSLGKTHVTPENFIMVFYAPADNLTLSIETALTKPENFYFPLTLQEGNAFKVSGMGNHSLNNNTVSPQHPVLWEMNVSSRFQSVKVDVSEGWYTLSWVGPVTVSGDGMIDLDCTWGGHELWRSVDDTRVWSYCQLVDDGVVVPFVVDSDVVGEATSVGIMMPSFMFSWYEET